MRLSDSTPTSPSETILDARLGYGLLRLTLGLDFLFHSYKRWIALPTFVESIVQEFHGTPLPVWSVKIFATIVPFLEPLVGLLLVLGLWTRVALLAGATLVATFVFGTALVAQFTVLSEQLVYALLFFILLLSRTRYDYFSVDGWRQQRRYRGA